MARLHRGLVEKDLGFSSWMLQSLASRFVPPEWKWSKSSRPFLGSPDHSTPATTGRMDTRRASATAGMRRLSMGPAREAPGGASGDAGVGDGAPMGEELLRLPRVVEEQPGTGGER
jgi:hypothetical protein